MSERKSPHNISDAIRRLESATGNGNGQFSEDIEAIKTHLKSLKEDLKSAATTAFNENMSKARDGIKHGQEMAQEFGKDVDKRVHDNPWAAIGIAGLFAFLIGFLLGRKD